jgi:hypothetical protein
VKIGKESRKRRWSTSHIVLYSWIIVGNATATDAADSSTLSITIYNSIQLSRPSTQSSGLTFLAGMKNVRTPPASFISPTNQLIRSQVDIPMYTYAMTQ